MKVKVYTQEQVGMGMATTGFTVLHFCLLMGDLRAQTTDVFNVMNVGFVAIGVGIIVWLLTAQGVEIEFPETKEEEKTNG